jgi:hypothetical protein
VNARICSFIFHNFDRSVLLILFHFFKSKKCFFPSILVFGASEVGIYHTGTRVETETQAYRHTDIRLCGRRVDSTSHH